MRTQLRQALLARAVMIAGSDRVEARRRFREAAVLNPSDPRIWQALCNLADCRDEQVQCLRDLLIVAPDHQQARGMLRKALIDDARDQAAAGDRDAACRRWREAVDLTGGDIEAWLGLAETTTDSAESAHAIELAFQLDPKDARAKAAMERIHGPQIDPRSLPDGDDAFGRFDAAPQPAAAKAAEVDDSMFNALAALPATEPVPATHPAAASSAAGPIAGAAAGFNGDTPTVMVVDDSPTIRKILGLTLERAGYRVVAEASGESALETSPGTRAARDPARHRDAGSRWLRSLQAHQAGSAHAGRARDHAVGQGRVLRQGQGPHGRRHRVPHEAVRNAGRARRGDCALPARRCTMVEGDLVDLTLPSLLQVMSRE